MQLVRAHGLGNDYLVLETGELLSPARVRDLCDRHRGVGGDGVLEPTGATDADHGVRIWNPDGSVAEKSGNGLRIFARWLADRGAGDAFTVSTGFEVVRCRVSGDVVTIAMGAARFAPADVPVVAAGPVLDGPLDLGDQVLRVVAVGVGNPHCVVFTGAADLDALPWRAWGAAIETHPRFPNRTNVQVARIAGERAVEMRVWERGAGPTLASGTSSCAVAAAAVETGRLPAGPVDVHMPGGTLRVTVGADRSLELIGPVEVVGRVTVDPRWLGARST